MTSAARLEADQVSFRKRIRQFYWLATLALMAAMMVVALTVIVVVLKGTTMRVTTLQQLALAWAPAVFYVWALWAVQGLFSALSKKGFVFHDVIARALTRIGWALALGAAVSIAAMPFVVSLGAPIVGRFAIFNAPALTLGVVGLALIAIASMIRRAAQVEAKAASLQAVLNDFI